MAASVLPCNLVVADDHPCISSGIVPAVSIRHQQPDISFACHSSPLPCSDRSHGFPGFGHGKLNFNFTVQSGGNFP